MNTLDLIRAGFLNRIEKVRFPRGRGYCGLSKNSQSHAAQKREAAKRKRIKARSGKRK